MSIKIKKWVLTPHAAEKIIERGISVQELDAVVKNPDTIIDQGPKLILTKRFQSRKDNNVAAVLLEKKDKDLWVVITVMVNFQKK